MPEEINRVVTDSPVRPALRAPRPTRSRIWRPRASTRRRVHLVGNPMIDSLFSALPDAGPGARGGPARRERVCRGDPAPPGQRRRPRGGRRTGRRRCCGVAARSRSWCRCTPRADPAGRGGPGRRTRVTVHRPTGLRGLPLARPGRRRWSSPTQAACRRRRPCSAFRASRVRPNTERPITITHGTNRLVTPARCRPRPGRRWPTARRRRRGELPPAVGRRRRAADRPGDRGLAQAGTTSRPPHRPYAFRITLTPHSVRPRRTMTYLR